MTRQNKGLNNKDQAARRASAGQTPQDFQGRIRFHLLSDQAASSIQVSGRQIVSLLFKQSFSFVKDTVATNTLI